ncbi:MAG TPA: HD domain-containing protein [Candidatus Limnocylindrales bacterium]|nr:HD domain-containing protein [Candidatus Limnocylindrales bacterium]
MPHTQFSGKFLFQPPPRLKHATGLTHTALQLASLSSRLALEDRTLVKHRGGRAENVAEHSFMLSVIAPVVAEEYYPELDANLIARFATVHDAVEAYVGDTATYDIDEAGLASKEEREKLGLQQLLHDYQGFKKFCKLVSEYEDQKVPEVRFVRVMDKLMPLLIHFAEGGDTLRGHIEPPELLENSALRASKLRTDYPEFGRLIDAREELALLASKHLY